jgi:Flp pilus assembly protein TadD
VQAWSDTLTLYQRSLEATPNSPTLHLNLGNRLMARGDEAAALAHYESARRLHPDWSPPAVAAAWLLATTPIEALRDPPRAVDLARRAVAGESPPDPNSLDTLAAAQAANGDFADAAATAQRAVEGAVQSGRTGSARAFEARRRLFAAGRPYLREGPSPADAGPTSTSTVR